MASVRTISGEAVEAAARVHQELRRKRGYPPWDALGAAGRGLRMKYMRAALEAAAPHMLEQAWGNPQPVQEPGVSVTLTPDALRYFEVIAAEAERDIWQLPEGSQPLWFRQFHNNTNPYRSQA